MANRTQEVAGIGDAAEIPGDTRSWYRSHGNRAGQANGCGGLFRTGVALSVAEVSSDSRLPGFAGRYAVERRETTQEELVLGDRRRCAERVIELVAGENPGNVPV